MTTSLNFATKHILSASDFVSSTDFGYQAYKITCTKDVFGGEVQTGRHSRVGQIVYVPWRVDFMEYPGRVMNLSN